MAATRVGRLSGGGMSSSLVLVFVFVVVAFCFAWSPLRPLSVHGATFPLAVSSQYQAASLDLTNANANPTLAYISTPALLAGAFAFVMAPFTGPMFRNTSCKVPGAPCFQTFSMQLLNSADDPYGCNITHAYDDGGQPIGPHTILLIERGGSCFFGNKGVNAAAIGAGAVMYHGCDPAAPSNCATGLTITYSRLNVTIPSPYMQYADALQMRTYLKARNTWLKAQAANTYESSSTGAASETFYSSSSSSSSSTGAAESPYAEPLMVSFTATGALIASEREALVTIVRNLEAKGSINDYTLTQPGSNGWTSLRGWSSINMTGPDPCLDRVVGLTCEKGHLVAVWMLATNGPVFIGPMDSAWGSFSMLRSLELSNNGFGKEVPAAVCNLTRLHMFGMDRQTVGITALPECLADLPLLFLSFSDNLLTAMPERLRSGIGGIGLQFLVLDSNNIKRLPSNFSLALVGLVALELDYNSIAQPPPSFQNWVNLTTLVMNDCGLTGPFPTSAFDGAASLTSADMSSNSINGSLPAFVGCNSLVTIEFSDNNFSGGIPTTWASLSSVTTIRLEYNSLSYPMTTLGAMVSVESIWLQHNQIYTPTGIDAGTLVAKMCSNNIVDLALDYNNITGGWQAGLLTATTSFDTFSMSHNGLQALPTDMWNVKITRWDLSYNNLSGPLPLSQPTSNSYINWQGNPNLHAWPLPSWLEQTSTLASTSSDSDFVCESLEHTTLQSLTILVDPVFTEYHGCTCIQGTFGFPPLCGYIPETATVSPLDGFSSSEIGSNFNAMIDTSPSTSTPAPETEQNSTGTDLFNPAGFSDQWYGSERLTLGIATTWDINIMNLFQDTLASGTPNTTAVRAHTVKSSSGTAYPVSPSTPNIVELLDAQGNVTYIESSTVNSLARYQPVRMITLQLHISRTLFNSASDTLFVYEGSPLLTGARVATLLGTDEFGDPPSVNSSSASDRASITLTPAYIKRYGDQMAAIENRTLVEVVVMSSQAAIYFGSRSLSGQHIFITYTYEFACLPAGLYYLSDNSSGGTACASVLPVYDFAPAIRVAVFAVGSVCMVWLALNTALLLWRWDMPLYRAASRWFLLLTLFFLGAMTLGALLYAAVPSVHRSSDQPTANAICIGRAWLTCLPLAGILAILIAKSNRVDSIFGSMSLVRTKNVSDLAIVKYIVAICSVQVALLLVWSFLPLTKPQYAPGAGSLSNQMVTSCSIESGGYAWIGAQIGYFSVLMLAAAFLAFKTRDIPSAFNESGHITNCILVIIFSCAIIVPLDFYVHTQPESAVLLQGLGQLFLVAMLSSILFAPKMYIVLTRGVTEQKAMMTSATAGTMTGSSMYTQSVAPSRAGGAAASRMASTGAPRGGAASRDRPHSARSGTGANVQTAAARPPLPVARTPTSGSPALTAAVATKPPSPRVSPTDLPGFSSYPDRIDETGESLASSPIDDLHLDSVELSIGRGSGSSTSSGGALLARDFPSGSVGSTPSDHSSNESNVPYTAMIDQAAPPPPPTTASAVRPSPLMAPRASPPPQLPHYQSNSASTSRHAPEQ